jgi:hypothetical protein
MYAISNVACPECSATTAYLLRDVSVVSYVDWFRCAKCGNVWSREKPTDTPNPPKLDLEDAQGRPEECPSGAPRHADGTAASPPPNLRGPQCDGCSYTSIR